MEIEYNMLDDKWINEFEKIDNLYKDFYKDDLYYVNLRIIYINTNNEVIKLKHDVLMLKNKNKILQEEIIGILKQNSIDNDVKYSLLSMLRYNVLIEPDDIKYFLTNDKTPNYLSIIKNIDDIVFEKTITMFQDLNDLIIVFYEKSLVDINKKKSNTKRIYLHNSSNNKKTLKKLYKD